MRERALSGLETPGSGMAREVGLFQMRKQGHRYGSHRHRAPGGRLGLRSKNDYNRQTIPIRRVQTDDPKVRGDSVRRDASNRHLMPGRLLWSLFLNLGLVPKVV